MNSAKKAALKELCTIPGIGPRIAEGLLDLNIRRVADLKGKDPARLYAKSCDRAGEKIDRCLLYAYRCAVYYATERKPRPDLLKWWNWKDR